MLVLHELFLSGFWYKVTFDLEAGRLMSKNQRASSPKKKIKVQSLSSRPRDDGMNFPQNSKNIDAAFSETTDRDGDLF